MLGVINMITSYFQALGEAMKSLTITVLRNAVLFIPGVVVLNYFWKLNGVIAAQPVVENINGWFVGFLEAEGRTYCFATNLQGSKDCTGPPVRSQFP